MASSEQSSDVAKGAFSRALENALKPGDTNRQSSDAERLAQATSSSDALGAKSDLLVEAVTSFAVENDAQWLALSRILPGVEYFATDVDSQSFEKNEPDGTWIGRAELLLHAPAEIRPGQEKQEVSFTMPVRVALSESGEEFSVKAFDFYLADESESPTPYYDPDDGPPKTIGWGPFTGLIKE